MPHHQAYRPSLRPPIFEEHIRCPWLAEVLHLSTLEAATVAATEEAEWEVFLKMARAREEAAREVGQRPKWKRRCGVFRPVRAAT
jgi:hypothetical protein